MSKAIDITIRDWIDYKPNVGVEMLQVSGLPGYGKTSMGNTLILECATKGESWVIPGDRFCEWRHFHKYSLIEEIIVIIPLGLDIYYHGDLLNKWKLNNNTDIRFVELDYAKINIMDYLPDDGKVRMVAVFDAHYKINKRSWLWVNISNQLINRTTHLDKCIGILFNEAGILFPQNAQGDHWKAVAEFATTIVDARKGLLRLIFISQIQTEIMDTVRKKCMFKVFRKGWVAKDEPKAIRKAAPFTARNEYHLSCGGLYCKSNTIDKFIEEKEISKMIPSIIINETSLPTRPLPTTSIDRGSGVGETIDATGENDAIKTISFRTKVNRSKRYSLTSHIDDLGGLSGDPIEITIKKLVPLEET